MSVEIDTGLFKSGIVILLDDREEISHWFDFCVRYILDVLL